MKPLFSILIVLCTTAPLAADIAIAARNIRPGEVLAPEDIILMRGETEGAFSDPAALVGQEAKVALYAGRTILDTQIGTAARVERNQIIELVYAIEGLSMKTEGRALARGGEGQRIRVMNLSSKTSLFGTVQRDGTVRVSN